MKTREHFQQQAKLDFCINRPWGIRMDLRKKTIALFNRKYNELGKEELGKLENLPDELFLDIEDIPVDLAQSVERNGDKAVWFFYDDETMPFRNNTVDKALLLNYNRRMFRLSEVLCRKL